jgi:putative metallohydrolase (TIGR04338 family)
MSSTTKDRWGRDRDNQRQRLYDAEGVISGYTSNTAKKLLDRGPTVRTTGSVSIEACQAYVDHVTSRAWFQRRWGKRSRKVGHKVSGKATWDGRDISLPPWSRSEDVILHELAHSLAPGGAAAHGPEFAGILLCLVEHMCGKEAKSALIASFRKGRVRWTPSAVPAPNQPVVTAAAQAARKRQEAARPLSSERATTTAEAIRQAVRQGLLGAVGTKERAAALASARKLETYAAERNPMAARLAARAS